MVFKKVFCANIFGSKTVRSVDCVFSTKTKSLGSSFHLDAECFSSFVCASLCDARVQLARPMSRVVELYEEAQLLFKETPRNEHSIRARLRRKTDMTK